MDKVWRSLQAFGDIAFAYSYSLILIEIQDTIRSPPPSESTVVSVAVTTLFYLLCGCAGLLPSLRVRGAGIIGLAYARPRQLSHTSSVVT
ncbi:hypothetical protein EJB05_18206, partial [Eragrostis curvula]